MKRWRSIGLCCVVSVFMAPSLSCADDFAQQTLATKDTSDAVTADKPSGDLKKTEHLHTMRALFTQYTYDENDSIISQTKGELWLEQPNKLRWSAKGEDGDQLIVSDGTTLWQYDVDLGQVTKQKFDNFSSENPLYILTEPFSNIRKHYMMKGQRLIAPHVAVLTLVPRDVSGTVDHVEVKYASGKVSAVTVYDRFNSRILLDLRRVRENLEMNDSLFTFEVPYGTDVIDADEMGEL